MKILFSVACMIGGITTYNLASNTAPQVIAIVVFFFGLISMFITIFFVE